MKSIAVASQHGDQTFTSNNNDANEMSGQAFQDELISQGQGTEELSTGAYRQSGKLTVDNFDAGYINTVSHPQANPIPATLVGRADPQLIQRMMAAGTGQFDDMLTKYREVTEINNESLRQAKNLEDLVGIQVKRVEDLNVANMQQFPQIQNGGMTPGTLEASMAQHKRDFDPRADPMLFRQKVPSLGDRRFLVNQAILSSSVQKQPAHLHAKRAARLGSADNEMLPSLKPGQNARAAFSSAASTASFQRYKNTVDALSKVTPITRGEVESGQPLINNLEPESIGDGQEKGGMTASGGDHSPLKDKSIEQQEVKVEQDPIHALKDIFKPRRREYKRKVLDMNPIVHKYRQKAREAQRNLSTGGTVPLKSRMQPKSFAEDQLLTPNPIQADYVPTPIESTASAQLQQQDQYTSASQRTVDVRARLDNLRKLFNEEDMNEAVQEIQLEWDLEDQKNQLQREARNLKHDQAPALEDLSLMKERVRQIKGGVGLDEGQEFPRVDLRDFLADQIKEFKSRADPANIERRMPDLDYKKTEVVNKAHETRNNKHKFKASTLTHIAELKNMGQDRIENLYIERVCREQSDYFFERYQHNKAKEMLKTQKIMMERQKMSQERKNVQIVFNTSQQPNMMDVMPFTPNSNQFAMSQAPNQSEQSRYAKRQSVNVIQDKMQRIAQIDKGLERSFVKQGDSSKEELFSPVGAAADVGQTSGHMDMIKLQFSDKNQVRHHIVHQKPQVSYEEVAISSLLQADGKPQTMPQSPTNQVVATSPEGTLKTSGEGLISQTQRDDEQDEPQKILISQPAESQEKQTRNESSVDNKETIQESQMAPIDQDDTDQSKDKKDQKPKSRERTQLLPALKELRVDQMVKEFNEKRAASPVQNPMSEGNMSDDPNYQYLTDSEVNRKTRKGFPIRPKNDSRAAGFSTNQKATQAADIEHIIQVPGQFFDTNNRVTADKLRELAKHLPQNQQAAFENFGVVFQPKQMEIVNKRSHSYFCPKRFNRYPRFTIFFKKDGNIAVGNKDNVVSLSPHVLQYLMDERKQSETQLKTEESAPEPPKVDIKRQSVSEGITTWNQVENKGHSYDPFEKVVLVKSIDNQILTSFRTLKRENNTVSETYKVLHDKFNPTNNKNSFYRALAHKYVNNNGLYTISDNEDAVEMAQAELLAEQFLQLQQEDDARTVDVRHSGDYDYMSTYKKEAQEFNVRISKSPETGENFKPQIDMTESMKDKSQAVSRANAYRKKLPINPKSQAGAQRPIANQVTGRSQYSSVEPGMKPAGVAQKVFRFEQIESKNQTPIDAPTSKKISVVETRSLQSNLQRAIGQTKDASEIPSFQNQILSDEAKAQLRPKNNTSKAKQPMTQQQQQHQIEVMVLSKVDPFDTAFPPKPQKQASDLTSTLPKQNKRQSTVGPGSGLPFGKVGTLKGVDLGYEESPGESNKDLKPPGIQKQPTVDDYTSLRSNPVGSMPRKTGLKESSVGENSSVMQMQISSQVRTVPREGILTDYTGQQVPDSATVQKVKLDTEGTGDVRTITPEVKFNSRGPTALQTGSVHEIKNSKYGSNFQIPDLPPILKEHLFPQQAKPVAAAVNVTLQASQDNSNSLVSPQSMSGVVVPNNIGFGNQKPYKIKQFINEIYQKDAKSRYHKQYVREDFLSAQSPIFDLQKFHALRPNETLIKSGKGPVKELKLTDSQRVQPSIQFVNLG